MVGGQNDKPTQARKIPLDPGVHVVKLKNAKTGYRDSDDKQWFMLEFATKGDNGAEGETFQHWIGCHETDYKSWDKVWAMAADQMNAIYVYDKVGEQPSYEKWFEAAADYCHALIGKKFEYEVQEYKIGDKQGVWGKVTGYLDIPNAAAQAVPGDAPKPTDTTQNMSAPQPAGNASPTPGGVDPNEQIKF